MCLSGRKNTFEDNDDLIEVLISYTHAEHLPQATADEAIKRLCKIGKNSPAVLNRHGPALIGCAGTSHPELMALIRDHNSWLQHPDILNAHLTSLIDSIGFAQLSETLLEASAKFGHSLVSGLESIADRLKAAVSDAELRVVMDILLNIALVSPDAVARFIPHISDSVGRNFALMLPLTRLLAAASTGGVHECITAVKHLAILVRYTCRPSKYDEAVDESSLEAEMLRSARWAVLGALDVAKDKMPRADFLHLETLSSLKEMSVNNPKSYENIVRFNEGNRAKRGKLKVYLNISNRVELYGLNEAGTDARVDKNSDWNCLFRKRQKVAVDVKAQPLTEPEAAKQEAAAEDAAVENANNEAVAPTDPVASNEAADEDGARQPTVLDTPLPESPADTRIDASGDDAQQADGIVGRNLFPNAEKDGTATDGPVVAAEGEAMVVEVRSRKKSVFGKISDLILRRHAVDYGKTKTGRRQGVDGTQEGLLVAKSPAAVVPAPDLEENGNGDSSSSAITRGDVVVGASSTKFNRNAVVPVAESPEDRAEQPEGGNNMQVAPELQEGAEAEPPTDAARPVEEPAVAAKAAAGGKRKKSIFQQVAGIFDRKQKPTPASKKPDPEPVPEAQENVNTRTEESNERVAEDGALPVLTEDTVVAQNVDDTGAAPALEAEPGLETDTDTAPAATAAASEESAPLVEVSKRPAERKKSIFQQMAGMFDRKPKAKSSKKPEPEPEPEPVQLPAPVEDADSDEAEGDNNAIAETTETGPLESGEGVVAGVDGEAEPRSEEHGLDEQSPAAPTTVAVESAPLVTKSGQRPAERKKSIFQQMAGMFDRKPKSKSAKSEPTPQLLEAADSNDADVENNVNTGTEDAPNVADTMTTVPTVTEEAGAVQDDMDSAAAPKPEPGLESVPELESQPAVPTTAAVEGSAPAEKTNKRKKSIFQQVVGIFDRKPKAAASKRLQAEPEPVSDPQPAVLEPISEPQPELEPVSSIQPEAEPETAATQLPAVLRVQEGSIVECNYMGLGNWYRGKIMKERPDGTFDIRYDDGESEVRVTLNFINLVESAVLQSAVVQENTPVTDGTMNEIEMASLPASREEATVPQNEDEASELLPISPVPAPVVPPAGRKKSIFQQMASVFDRKPKTAKSSKKDEPVPVPSYQSDMNAPAVDANNTDTVAGLPAAADGVDDAMENNLPSLSESKDGNVPTQEFEDALQNALEEVPLEESTSVPVATTSAKRPAERKKSIFQQMYSMFDRKPQSSNNRQSQPAADAIPEPNAIVECDVDDHEDHEDHDDQYDDAARLDTHEYSALPSEIPAGAGVDDASMRPTSRGHITKVESQRETRPPTRETRPTTSNTNASFPDESMSLVLSMMEQQQPKQQQQPVVEPKVERKKSVFQQMFGMLQTSQAKNASKNSESAPASSSSSQVQGRPPLPQFDVEAKKATSSPFEVVEESGMPHWALEPLNESSVVSVEASN
jgi:hypothetical protein